MPNTLMKVAKATAAVSARPAPASASTRRPARARQMEALEHRLENEPLADEARLRRHRGETHGAEQRAEAEQPCGAFDQQRMPDQVAAGRGEYTVGGEEQPAFRQRMPGEVQQRDRPREAGQVRQTALPEQQRSAQQRDRNRRILGRGKAEQAAPIFLLECVEHRQDRAEHADG